MNVAFDPWIPVISVIGERKLVSLEEVFTQGEKYADIVVRPHERVALMRLFICVAHAALNGPKDYSEWCDVPVNLSGAASNYLSKWKESFELFHEEKPWLQVAGLNALPAAKKTQEDVEWSTLKKLCYTRASGNNATLFDHEAADVILSKYNPSEIVLNLLTFQNFFVAGGKASARLWNNYEMKNPPNPKGGPCSGKSILFTFIRGNNLFESICLNLNTYEDLYLFYGDITYIGKPIWEYPIVSPVDKTAISNATKTHLGRLVPQTRLLRINKDCCRVLFGSGFNYPKYQDKNDTYYPDIFATLIVKKENEIELLSARPNHALWRELHSLLVRNKNSNSKNRGPLCLLNMPENMAFDIVVNAMVTNPNQPAEIVDLIDSVFHISPKLQNEEGRSIYESEINKTENVARKLGWAIESYAESYYEQNDRGRGGRKKADESFKKELKAKLHAKATIHYWTTVEKNIQLLMNHIEAIGTDGAIKTQKEWRSMIFTSACESYRIACGQETTRQMRAFAKGWQKLISKRIETEEDTNENKEVNA